jgi:hypothetical protein
MPVAAPAQVSFWHKREARQCPQCRPFAEVERTSQPQSPSCSFSGGCTNTLSTARPCGVST